MKSQFPVRRILSAAALLSCVGGALVDASPANVAQIKSRQDKLRDMGGALKAINDELKKRNVDWDNIILPNAETIKERSAYLLNWFPKGSGPESGAKTYALPAIWQKNDDFVTIGKALQVEAVKLTQVAATRNADALRTEATAMGKVCKSCHDSYRSPDYEKENDD